jgi:hypothetical protein
LIGVTRRRAHAPLAAQAVRDHIPSRRRHSSQEITGSRLGN